MVEFSNRTQIEFSGSDRATFLHNLCTNAVRDMPVGKGCEAFVLNVKGHVAGHVFLFVCPESIVLESVPGQSEKLLAHFNRYLIREDVQLADRSQTWAELMLSGRQADELLMKEGLPSLSEQFSHAACQLAGSSVWLRKTNLAGPDSYLLACPREFLEDVRSTLKAAGALPCGEEAFQAARIENGTPLFGQDVSEENLPQEIDRNRSTISFTKGCYLGQETVARIDALGHVNRLLRGVVFSGEAVPPPETPLHRGPGNGGGGVGTEGKTVGRVSSACWSPRLNAPLALALIHRESAAAGAVFQSPCGAAKVVALPLSKE